MSDPTTGAIKLGVGFGLMLVSGVVDKLHTRICLGRWDIIPRQHVMVEADSLLDDVLTLAPEESAASPAITSQWQPEVTNTVSDIITPTATVSPFEYEVPWNGSDVQASEPVRPFTETISSLGFWFPCIIFGLLLVCGIVISTKENASRLHEKKVSQLQDEAAQKLKETRDDYDGKLDEAKEETKKAEVKVQTSNAERDDYMTKLKAANEKIGEMAQKQSDTEEELGQMTSENTEAGKKIEELEKSIEKATSKKLKAGKKIEDLKILNKEFEKDKSDLESQLESMKTSTNQRISTLESELKTSQSENNEAAEEIKRLGIVNQDLTNEKTALEEKLKDAEAAAGEAKDKISGLEKDLETSEKAVSGLKQKLEEVDSARQNATSELSKERETSKQATEDHAREIADLNKKLETAHDTIATANTEKATVERQLSEANQNTSSEQDRLEKALAATKEDNQLLKRENLHLTKSLEESTMENQNIQEKLEEAEEEKDYAVTEMTHKHDQLDKSATAEKSKMVWHVEYAMSEYENLKSKHEELQKLVERLQADNEALRRNANTISQAHAADDAISSVAPQEQRPSFNPAAQSFAPSGRQAPFDAPAATQADQQQDQVPTCANRPTISDDPEALRRWKQTSWKVLYGPDCARFAGKQSGGTKKPTLHHHLFAKFGGKDDFLIHFHRRHHRRHSVDSIQDVGTNEWRDISYCPSEERIEMSRRDVPSKFGEDSWPYVRKWLAEKDKLKMPKPR